MTESESESGRETADFLLIHLEYRQKGRGVLWLRLVVYPMIYRVLYIPGG